MVDLLLKNAHLCGEDVGKDVAIQGERIVAVGPNLPTEARQVINVGGRTILPAFVDCHIHLDKAWTMDKITNESGTLEEAIDNFMHYFEQADEEDIYQRAMMAAERAVAYGTGALRTHTTVDSRQGLKALRPLLALRERLRGKLEIQVVIFPSFRGGDALHVKKLIIQALAAGADVLGGCPNLHPDGRTFIDEMFTLAREYSVPIDFHVDESDEPNADVLEYLAEKTLVEGMQGRVTASHCCSLAAVPQAVADRIIGKVRDAGLNVVTLPSCNMFLMGRRDPQPVRRGVTRVNELLQAGVNVAYASDNVRDPFRPFGNGDMLEEALFTAQVIQKGYRKGILEVLEMGTYRAAKVMGLQEYGLAPGNYADIVVLEAPDAVEAVLSQARRTLVIHRGRIVAREGKMVETCP
ncbi:MAG: amidohydrolase family protein [Thermoanaerobacteraceae bacterium]|nr:amidohydrolase family protein [Thermoanaerobacteraceae bacterium]